MKLGVLVFAPPKTLGMAVRRPIVDGGYLLHDTLSYSRQLERTSESKYPRCLLALYKFMFIGRRRFTFLVQALSSRSNKIPTD